MKLHNHIIFALLLSLYFSGAYAQTENDRFTDFAQIVGNEVYLFDIPDIILTNGKFVYYDDGGKLKSISTKEIFDGQKMVKMKGLDMLTIKDKSYLKCNCDGKVYFLYINPKKDSYIGKFRNVTYWTTFLNDNKESHCYFYRSDSGAKRLTDQYRKCEWKYANVPAGSINDEVTFAVNVEGNYGVKNIPYSQFMHPVDGAEYRTQSDYDKDNLEQNRLDSIQEIKDRVQDLVPLIAVCQKEYPYGDEDYQHTNEGDTVVVYKATEKEVSVSTGYANITADYSYFEISDNNQLAFLKRRGDNNVDARKALADSLANIYFYRDCQRLEKSLNASVAAYEARERELTRKQLFIEDIDYEYGDYGDFGMSFRIYNCFKKTIKYIEFTCVPYNAVGDVQADWVGKRVSHSKGIGPLEPGESASWSWNDLFYDKNDIIKKVRLTGIKFIFKDGTSLNFTGYQNISKHWKE